MRWRRRLMICGGATMLRGSVNFTVLDCFGFGFSFSFRQPILDAMDQKRKRQQNFWFSSQLLFSASTQDLDGCCLCLSSWFFQSNWILNKYCPVLNYYHHSQALDISTYRHNLDFNPTALCTKILVLCAWGLGSFYSMFEKKWFHLPSRNYAFDMLLCPIETGRLQWWQAKQYEI